MAWWDGKRRGPEEQDLDASHPIRPFTVDAQIHK